MTDDHTNPFLWPAEFDRSIIDDLRRDLSPSEFIKLCQQEPIQEEMTERECRKRFGEESLQHGRDAGSGLYSGDYERERRRRLRSDRVSDRIAPYPKF